ncbi:hypothetical protein SBOR_7158 [Sclerotinia borealis F-4128]|uniref:BTB domain-containing protein n=1 Tax=Sclerotinia borealis (strain F-4128) TaxID=1432307 RepID=W9C9C0_SCLBF|nr:hypothetical protein SBOR_7158 [Sclerotinia borealis F-4128]
MNANIPNWQQANNPINPNNLGNAVPNVAARNGGFFSTNLQYGVYGGLPVQMGPYRSYALVIRDYLTGNMSVPPPPPTHRAIPNQPMATHPNYTSLAAGPLLQGTSTGLSPADQSARAMSRLDLAAADHSQGPTWFDVSMDMITIYIKGESGEIEGPPFNLHKAFFTHLSPYFDAVFNSGFAESSTQTLHFAESNREIFALLVQWVYAKDLKTIATFELEDRKNLPAGVGLSTLQSDQLNVYVKKSQELAFEHTTKLIDLWFLADKVLMPTLQNAAILAIESLRFFTPLQGVPAEISRAAYDKTPKGSPLRRYLADTTLRRLHPNSEDDGEDFHPDMLVDIFNRVKIAGADARLRHYGLSERAMEAFLVEVQGGGHLKANPSTTPPLADDVWVGLWELRRDALKY